jgi:hypothetical protein
MNGELERSEAILSGDPGVLGPRRRLAARAFDWILDLGLTLRRTQTALDRAAARVPQRSVAALCVYRPGNGHAARLASDLWPSRHELRLVFGSTGEPDAALADVTVASGLAGGKFENLNELLALAGGPADWIVVLDDDVVLPPLLVDRAIGVCEALGLHLAQPALTRASHGAWRVVRRRTGIARTTAFVEIGPVTLMRAEAVAALTPFPPLRFGWGLDLHWGALARERGWRVGVIDALPVRHETSPVASAYSREDAIAEALDFLRDRPHLTAAEAQRTLASHRRLPT